MIQTLFPFSEWIKWYRPQEMVSVLLGSLTWSSASLWPGRGGNQVLDTALPPFLQGVGAGREEEGAETEELLSADG